jgi:hypothetical protein
MDITLVLLIVALILWLGEEAGKIPHRLSILTVIIALILPFLR